MALFPVGHKRTCRITINASQVVDSHNNFPVYLDESVLPLELYNSSDDNCSKNNGGDIRFSSDEQGTNQLPLEVVNFVYASSGPGSVNIWVLVPNITNSNDTDIWLWYDNSDADYAGVHEEFGKYAVWNSNYIANYHFQESPTEIWGGGFENQFLNSVQDTIHLAVDNAPASYTTLLGNAFTNPNHDTDSPISESDNNLLDYNSGDTLTISYLVKNSTSGSQLTHLSKGRIDNDYVNFSIRQNEFNGLDVLYRSATDDYYAVWRTNSPYLIDINNLYHIGITYTFGVTSGTSFLLLETGGYVLQEDGISKILLEKQDSTLKLVVNGVVFDGEWITGIGSEAPYVSDPSQNLIIGAIKDGAYSEIFDGVLDELRIGKSGFTTEWYQTEYNLYTNLSNFITAGTPEDFMYSNFTISKTKDSVPAYLTLTDISNLTSATDYTRIWSVTNLETSATEFFTSNASSYNLVLDGYQGLSYSINLSAIY